MINIDSKVKHFRYHGLKHREELQTLFGGTVAIGSFAQPADINLNKEYEPDLIPLDLSLFKSQGVTPSLL
jgi:hypothetical protein